MRRRLVPRLRLLAGIVVKVIRIDSQPYAIQQPRVLTSAAVNVVRFSPNGEHTPCHRGPDLWNAPPQLDMMVE